MKYIHLDISHDPDAKPGLRHCVSRHKRTTFNVVRLPPSGSSQKLEDIVTLIVQQSANAGIGIRLYYVI